jgi:hypothetical protein
MDLKKLADEAKKVVAERGGIESVKEDALEVKDVVTGTGSLTEKAKETVEALKVPGTNPTPPAAS